MHLEKNMPEKGEMDELDERLVTDNMGTRNKEHDVVPNLTMSCRCQHLIFLEHVLIRIHLMNLIRNSCFGNKVLQLGYCWSSSGTNFFTPFQLESVGLVD